MTFTHQRLQGSTVCQSLTFIVTVRFLSWVWTLLISVTGWLMFLGPHLILFIDTQRVWEGGGGGQCGKLTACGQRTWKLRNLLWWKGVKLEICQMLVNDIRVFGVALWQLVCALLLKSDGMNHATKVNCAIKWIVLILSKWRVNITMKEASEWKKMNIDMWFL